MASPRTAVGSIPLSAYAFAATVLRIYNAHMAVLRVACYCPSQLLPPSYAFAILSGTDKEYATTRSSHGSTGRCGVEGGF